MEKLDNLGSIKAPLITYDRIRMQTDGKGVTTLVIFHGCPLRCKWCINAFTCDPYAKRKQITPEELYNEVKIDELYFLSTGGGITFGGGEPLLYPDFLLKFREICGKEWHLCAETSLWVPFQNVSKAAECIDMFYIDCKDTNPEIYESYAGRKNSLMLENLEKLLGIVGPERIIVRVPLIPDFNTDEDREKSLEKLKAMGIKNFDLFNYLTHEEIKQLKQNQKIAERN